MRYTNFDSTALCKRCVLRLVTGRNHAFDGLRSGVRTIDRLSRLRQHYDRDKMLGPRTSPPDTRPDEKDHRHAPFDKGWHGAVTDRLLQPQKRPQPAGRQAQPWPNDLLKHGGQLTPDEKKLFLLQPEVFAAYSAYTDRGIASADGTRAKGSLIATPHEGASLQMISQARINSGSTTCGASTRLIRTWPYHRLGRSTKQAALHFGGVRPGTAIS